MFTPPMSRQPDCRFCDHERHLYTRCHAELGRTTDDDGLSVALLCPCPPSRPTGIYEESP